MNVQKALQDRQVYKKELMGLKLKVGKISNGSMMQNIHNRLKFQHHIYLGNWGPLSVYC